MLGLIGTSILPYHYFTIFQFISNQHLDHFNLGLIVDFFSEKNYNDQTFLGVQIEHPNIIVFFSLKKSQRKLLRT